MNSQGKTSFLRGLINIIIEAFVSFTVRLGLDHLAGTPMLKPYMHGYFISLKLYDAARVIANPFAYAEHREKIVREKMEKMAETRIRSRKDAGVKVNKALAEKVLKEEERAKKREERKKAKKAAAATAEEDGEDVGMEDVEDESATQKLSLLSDPRFAKVFEDPEFAIDENSREYALLNPSNVAQRKEKTAVEDEEDESDKMSSDGLGDSDSENSSNNDSNSSSEDSSDAGGMSNFLTHRLVSFIHYGVRTSTPCPYPCLSKEERTRT